MTIEIIEDVTKRNKEEQIKQIHQSILSCTDEPDSEIKSRMAIPAVKYIDENGLEDEFFEKFNMGHMVNM